MATDGRALMEEEVGAQAVRFIVGVDYNIWCTSWEVMSWSGLKYFPVWLFLLDRLTLKMTALRAFETLGNYLPNDRLASPARPTPEPQILHSAIPSADQKVRMLCAGST